LRNRIFRNSFSGNGSNAIDLLAVGGDENVGDGISVNDGAPGACGYLGTSGNQGLDYPTITTVDYVLGTTTIVGQACPSSDIEVYRAAVGAGDTLGADDYGEGERYLGTTSTDGAGDFSFVTTDLVPGNAVTTLAIDGTDNTSEFSANELVINDADLVMTKVLDPGTPGPFAEGDTVTYLLTVTNNGPVAATSVTATDTYPAELTLGTATPSAPTTYNSGTGVWDIGSLAVSGSATLTLTGTVNAGTAGDIVTNSVTAASADQTDPTTTGDDLDEIFTVLPFLSIDDVTQVETDSGTTTFTFTVSINQAVGYDITFDIDTADDTATTADSDYVAISGGSGTLTNGTTSTTIDVTVNGDTKLESDETFFVNLSNVVGASVTDGQGEGTITNDDAASYSIDDVTAVETDSGTTTFTFTVTLDEAVEGGSSVDYTTTDGTATTADSDYVAASGTLNFTGTAGETQTVDVTVNGDTTLEADETFTVDLSNPTNSVTISDAQGVGTLTNDDAASYSIDDVTAVETDSGTTTFTFTVTLDEAVAGGSSVDYTTNDGTATTADSDYVAASGTLNFTGTCWDADERRCGELQYR
jgi:hypothetical protein